MERYVTRMQALICKIFFYYISFVSTAYDKIIDSVLTVGFEDMPKYRLAADFYHGLGLEVGFLADASAKPPRQDDSFHAFIKVRWVT